MTQAEVLEYLEENKGKWFSTKELIEIFKSKSVTVNLSRMYNSSQRQLYNIHRRIRKGTKVHYEWTIK